MMKFKKAAIGGTFDLLHQGHQALINKAFEIGERVFIGIVINKSKIKNLGQRPIVHWTKRSKPQIKNQKERIRELVLYLKKKDYYKRASIEELKDNCGPTIIDTDFEAIVVSRQTIKGAEKINRIRRKKGFRPLEVIVIPMEKDENGEIISSTRIRRGEINRRGFSYLKLFNRNLIIADKTRKELRKPQGKIIKELGVRSWETGEENNLIIIIGDWTLKRFVKNKLSFDLALIDNLCRRQPVSYFSEGWLKKRIVDKVSNPAGTISRKLADTIIREIKKSGQEKIILVNGEEDLGAVPAILLSPLNSLVFYGQPEEGVIEVLVNEEIKEKLARIIRN